MRPKYWQKTIFGILRLTDCITLFFYAVNALLVLNEIHTKSHSATRSQFSLLFVKTGKFDKKYGRLLSELFDWRQKGDYENIYEYDKASVIPLLEPVEEMLHLIRKEVKKSQILND
jgi:hypothetical protein